MSKFKTALDNYFKVSERGSSISKEVVAGLTTFMAMAYILMVNAGMFANLPDTTYGAVYIATAISAIVGTLIMGLYANVPFAQASGMGLNAYFVFTVCFGYGYTYANGLVLVLISGLVFLLLTFVGIREKIVLAVPKSVKLAIPAGIGIFIAFLGLQNCGLIIGDGATLVKMVSLNMLVKGTFTAAFPAICTLLGLLIIAILSKFKVKGAIIWGILATTVLYYIVGLPSKIVTVTITASQWNPFNAFKDFGTLAVGQVFVNGFSGLFSGATAAAVVGKVFQFLAIVLAFCMVDMFDTIGTLLGTAKKADMLDEDGNLPNMKKALFADATATVAGAICGTSTVTTYVESAAGVAEGGRTGLTAVVVAICFFVAMFLSPLAMLIPGCATATALIYVGVLMIGTIKDIEFNDPAIAVPAFLTVVMMAFTYNISFGIALGLISHLIINAGVLVRDAIKKEVNKEWVKENFNPITIILGILFLLMFLFTH